MKKSQIVAMLICFCLAAINTSFAQTKKTDKAKTTTENGKKLTRIRTTDENEYIGEKISEDKETIIIKTETLGEIKIKKSIIDKVEEVSSDQLSEGKFLIENAHSSRYFWAPNGFGLKKGEGYYQNTWVLLNQVSYGFTDHFTVGVGTIPLFLFSSSAGVLPIWVTPKVQFEATKNVNVGLGVIYGGVISTNNNTNNFGAGIAYGVTTLGDRNRNLSIGVGYGFSGGTVSKTPVFNLSGMYRVGKRMYLMTENWFITAGGDGGGIFSLGGRYAAKSLAFDFGVFRPFVFSNTLSGGSTGRFVLPWLGVNVPFGNKIKEKK
jgi:hypothetical protein